MPSVSETPARGVRFSSSLATVLTMVGVAVGLGNVWRFPYMMGRFGGSAFLVVYLGFVLLVAMPALVAEWALGRETRQGPLGALAAAFGRRGGSLGRFLVATVFVATSYYTVVVANVVYTAAFSMAIGFDEQTLDRYRAGLENGGLQAGIGLGLVASVLLVLHLGLRRGVERLSKLFVPAATLVMVYLIASALALPGAVEATRSFLRPDFASLTPTSLFAAMGQAFFSLSLGGTFYVIYGSYLRDEEKLPRSALLTAAGDVGAALMASLFIVPACLAFQLDLESGPRLLFESLPRLFAAAPGGRLLGSLFLLALSTMAYLSILAAYHVLLGGLRMRVGAPALLGLGQTLLLVPVALRPQVIATLDLVFGSAMQCLGSGLAVVALAWGLGRETVVRQVFAGGASGIGPSLYVTWIRWVVPAALAVVLGLYLVDSWG